MLSEPAATGMVVDFRRYDLHPGQRDILIDVFDTYLIEGQEETGMHVVGQFRDLDAPDRFVWLREFPDMATRGRALEEFYSGPVWRTNSAIANATMIDVSDCFLLRPAGLSERYPLLGGHRPEGPGGEGTSLVAGTRYDVGAPGEDDGFLSWFLDVAQPVLADTGAELDAVFVTEHTENNFPALPVRDENVLVWFATFDDEKAHRAHQQALAGSSVWARVVEPELAARLHREPEQLRLRPTARSQFR